MLRYVTNMDARDSYMRNRRPSWTSSNHSTQSSASLKPRPIQVCVGLIGRSLETSRMPLVHMSEGQALGLDLHVDRIDPAEMKRARPSLAEMLDTIEMAGFSGALVSAPYKQAAVAHLDELSETARRVGAVTTIAFRGGVRLGHNSLSWAFAETMRRGLFGAKLDTVLIVGAGGTGGAVAHALTQLNVGRILIHDADPALAEQTALSCGGVVANDLTAAMAEADGIVNATQIGRADMPGLPLPVDHLEQRHWVADLIDIPFETELVTAAHARGCAVLNGVNTATYKAIHDFHLLTGRAPSVSRIRAAVEMFGGIRRPRPRVVA